MKKYKVTFDRIGRRRDVPPAELTAETDADLADQIHIAASRYLLSREYDVYANIETGKGYIDGGRFGAFFIEAVDA